MYKLKNNTNKIIILAKTIGVIFVQEDKKLE